MTRTISADLLAAAQSLRARPTLSADIIDKRLRWTLPISNGINSDNPTDLAYHTNKALRVRIGAAGAVYSQVITTLATDAEWDSWTTEEATGIATNYGDCAIAAYSATQWIIYFAAPNGGNFGVGMIYSSDSGANWSAAALILSGLAVEPRVAAHYKTLVVQESGNVDAYDMTWAAPPTFSAARGLGGYTATNEYGVACGGRQIPVALYHILVAHDGLIQYTSYTSPTWTALRNIYPSGSLATTAPSGAKHAHPAITANGTTLLASWLEDYDHSPSAWNLTVTHVSLDTGLHFGQECSQSMHHGTAYRAGLCYVPSEHAFYCAIERQTAKAIAYDASDANSNHTALPVLSYRRTTHAQGTSRLEVRIHEPAAAYQLDGLADPHPVHPLAWVIVNRGWNGTTEALDPHYLVASRRTEYKKGGVLELECLDTWGILERWSPHRTITWSGDSIAWLCAEICAQVGIRWDFDGDAAWFRTITTFVIRPTETGATAMRALIRLAGGVTRTTEAGKLYGINLVAHTQTEPTIGNLSEILEASLGTTLWSATTVRHIGDGQADYIENANDAMELGMRLNMTVFDRREDTSLIVQEAATRDLLLAHASGRSDLVTVPLRPDLELWDLILLAASGVGPPKRMITGITEVADIQHMRLESRLTLSADPT